METTSKYKVLQSGSGKTAYNGVYPFTLNAGDLVDGYVSNDGHFVMVLFPQLAPAQKDAPIARMNTKFLQLQRSDIPTTPATKNDGIKKLTDEQMKGAPVTPVNKDKGVHGNGSEPTLHSSQASWYPYAGAGIGVLAGAYIGKKRNSQTFGYLAWMAVLGAAGYAMAGLLNSKQGSSGFGAGESKDNQIKNKVNALLDKAIQLAPKFSASVPDFKKQATPEKIALVKNQITSSLDAGLAKLNNREKDISMDALNEVDKAIAKIASKDKLDPMEAFSYFAEMQSNLLKKYSEKELKDYGDKLAAIMPQDLKNIAS